MRILIVKEPDCPTCSEFDKEHSVVIADNLEMARREITKGPNLFDLVILYSPFSHLAGPEFTREVKKQIPFATVVLRNQVAVAV